MGTVTSSAVPRMPSGPALVTRIDAAVKWVRSMFLSVVMVNWMAPLVSDVNTWPGVGLTNWAVGAVWSTMNGNWALGSLGLD